MILEQIWEKALEGGIIMIPICLLSLLLWYRIVERFFWFRKEEKRSKGLMRGVRAGLALEKFDDQYPKGWQDTCLGHLVRKGLLLPKMASKKDINSIMYQALIASEEVRTKYLNMISALAMSAPLLGLLGTVTGMISTFRVITHSGKGDMTGMAGGISQALVTTQAGLIVALPAVFLHGVLRRKADVLYGRMEAAASELKRILGKEDKQGRAKKC